MKDELNLQEKKNHLKNLMRQLNNTQEQLNQIDLIQDEDEIDDLIEVKKEKIRQIDKKQGIDW